MKTLSLALRNLLRNRRRSLTTLLAMVVGAVSILLFGGYVMTVKYGLQTDYVEQSGHLQIQHRDYFLYGSGNPAAYGIADYQRVIDTLRRDPVLAPMLTVVTPTLSLDGIAGNFAAGVSRTFVGSGVVVVDQLRMRQWNDYGFTMSPRRLALEGTPVDSAVIGTGVARVLQLCEPLKVANCATPRAQSQAGAAAPADVVALSSLEAPARTAATGAHIELLAANVHGAPNVAELHVVKAESQGIKEYDDLYVGMHLAQAQRLIYGTERPQVTAVVLQLRHTRQIPAATARIGQLLQTALRDLPLEVHDYATLNPSYGQIIGMFSAIFGFISVLIGTIVLFTVSNTMTMAVVERTVEIGTLRAMGMRRSGIRRLFICEGLLLGVLGALVGVCVALALAWCVNHSGLSWLPPGNTNRVPLAVRVWGETSMIVTTSVLLVLVSVLSAWFPARRAARLNIVDALRHV
jgi:putative ABC transport system permease protein